MRIKRRGEKQGRKEETRSENERTNRKGIYI